MKVIKQTKLLSSILTSDILYFSGTKLKKKNSNFYFNQIKVKQKTNYILLNVILLLQSIKQLIRILQFNIKYYKNFLQIITSNNLYNKIIEYISNLYNLDNVKIHTSTKFEIKSKQKMIAYIGDDISQNLKHTIQKTFNNNINLIILINSSFNKNFFGNYKMLTNINNYKKLIFLILIILLSQKSTEKIKDTVNN